MSRIRKVTILQFFIFLQGRNPYVFYKKPKEINVDVPGEGPVSLVFHEDPKWTILSTGAPRNPISLNSEHPPLGFHLSKTKKIIILDYFKPYYPLGSVFNSLKIQNEPFLSTGAPRNPISLNTPLLDFSDIGFLGALMWIKGPPSMLAF